MSGINDPKVNIPHYDVPAGTRFRFESKEGSLTFEKQEDGEWEVVNFKGVQP